MSAASYNRGSRALRASIDREHPTRAVRRVRCQGRMQNGPGKRYAYCGDCRHVNYELNEGDRCPCLHPEK